MHRYLKFIALGSVIVLPVVLLAQIDSTTSTSNTASAPSTTTTTTTTDTSFTTQTTVTPQTTTTSTGQTVPTTTSTQDSAIRQTTTTTGGTVATERVARCVAQVEEILTRASGDTLAQCTTTLTRVSETVRARRAAEVQAIAQSRAEWDRARAAQFAQLRTLATTDRQKRAVEAFINAMSGAVSTRKQGVNAAVDAYYTAHERATISRRNEANAALARHEQTLTELGRDARAQCAVATETNTIRASLLEKRQAAVRSLASVGACQGLDAVAEATAGDQAARSAAIERSLAEFRTKAAAARAELRATFGLPAEG